MLTPDEFQAILDFKAAVAHMIEEQMEKVGASPAHLFDFVDSAYDAVQMAPGAWLFANYQATHKQSPDVLSAERSSIRNDHPMQN